MFILDIRDAAIGALGPPIELAIQSLLSLRKNQAAEAIFYIVEPGDRMPEVEQVLGFPLLVDLTDDGPAPSWEWVIDHGGSCFEAAFILADDFAHVLIVPNNDRIDQTLISLLNNDTMPPPAVTNTESI